MKRVELQPAYVLHRRSYGETSSLIEIMTPEHGRLSVIAKGVRKARSATSGILQPFQPLFISWVGRGELMTLTQADTNANIVTRPLRGECLFAGFYLNELMICLLQKWDPHPKLYEAYEKTLVALQTQALDQTVLRSFEKFLLEELGYGVLTSADIDRLQPECHYRFIPEQGFQLCEQVGLTSPMIFSGKSLLAFIHESWSDAVCLQDAKRIIRILLTPLLGARPLHSRRLFLQVEEALE